MKSFGLGAILFFALLCVSTSAPRPRTQAAASDVDKELAAEPSAGGTVTRTLGGGGGTWRLDIRIDQPNVRQHATIYRYIEFQPLDKVTISAGGCVQTGGRGRTWKRYVDPQGPNSDRPYHGLIAIPGVIGEPATLDAVGAILRGGPVILRRIRDVNHRTFTLPPLKSVSPGHPEEDAVHDWASVLVLGYEDDEKRSRFFQALSFSKRRALSPAKS